MRVRVASPGVSPEVSVKLRTDVPEFMKNGHQFFLEFDIHEPRQVEAQDVEHFLAFGAQKLLYAPTTTVVLSRLGTVFKAHGCQSSEKPMVDAFAGLGEGNRNTAEIDVAELGKSPDGVFDHRSHVRCEVKPTCCRQLWRCFRSRTGSIRRPRI